jgi:protein-S-isoprenylcysteine O-methyltransferase Ste14
MQSEPDIKSTAKKVVSNIMQGPFGQRGEAYVFLQFFFISQVIFPPSFLAVDAEIPEALQTILFLVGFIPFAFGLALVAQGASTLGENFTPLPQPTPDNQLKTEGVYALCRHPIYGGFLLSSLGLSMMTASPARLFFAALLLAVLERKAVRCESSYNSTMPQFWSYFAARPCPVFLHSCDTDKL